MQIIGLSGTNGSGKDTVAAMLAEKYGFLNISATEMLADELKKRGWPIDRTHKSRLSAEWRREFGMAVIVDKAVEAFRRTDGKYRGLVVGSLRHPGEAERIRELTGTTVWVDAEPAVRYARVTSNARGANKSAEDSKTFEEFLADEAREMRPEGDDATLNMSAVKELSDLTLVNNGNDIEAFKQEAEAALQPYLKAR